MNKFVSFITGGWAAGITLSPFGIYIKENYLTNKYIINHESIHWKQQMEMGILLFYIWYGIEWFIKMFIYGKEQAYYHLSFELEAYNSEDDLNYLIKRKHFSWFKYINK
jgi:hypothetical protein